MTHNGIQATWREPAYGHQATRDSAASARQELQQLQRWFHKLRSNRALLRRAERGDDLAYAELVNRFRDPIYTMALASLGSPERAGDVVCEVFVSAYRRIGRGRACSPRAWFHLLALGAVLRRLGGDGYTIDLRKWA